MARRESCYSGDNKGKNLASIGNEETCYLSIKTLTYIWLPSKMRKGFGTSHKDPNTPKVLVDWMRSFEKRATTLSNGLPGGQHASTLLGRAGCVLLAMQRNYWFDFISCCLSRVSLIWVWIWIAGGFWFSLDFVLGTLLPGTACWFGLVGLENPCIDLGDPRKSIWFRIGDG